jgi:hypothetical protein
MATNEQIEANRENAKLSTGPTSSTGLERSSKNAIKHGLVRIPMMSISRSEVMAISAERNDARLFQCESVIGIRQDF